MKKLLVFIIMVTLVAACSKRGEVIEKESSSSINSYKSLIDQTDHLVMVKVLDDLSSDNSFYSEDAGNVSDFYSKREVELLDDFGSGLKFNSIYFKEAKVDRVLYKYSGNRSLKKNRTYLIYLEKNTSNDDLYVANYQGAIIDLDEKFEQSTPEVTLTDFLTLLTTDKQDTRRFEKTKYIPGIKELKAAEKYSLEVGKISIDYNIAPYEDNTSILEVGSYQYLIE